MAVVWVVWQLLISCGCKQGKLAQTSSSNHPYEEPSPVRAVMQLMVISKRKQRKVSREKLLLGNYVGPRFHVLLGDGFLPNVE